VGNTALPAEVADVVTAIENSVTCNAAVKTIGNVPDVIQDGVTFSSINFAASTQSPLAFALSEFATANPLASTDLAAFETNLNLYLATEAGIRSEAGNLAIKVPKFFLAFQVARIKTAKGIEITDPGQTVEHLLEKVQKNAGTNDKALLGQVVTLSTKLA